ncbi:hypothetical protein FRC10_002651, partial [Ceratobasidium sp. 414]
VTSPAPVEHPPPHIIRVGTGEPERDYTPQILRVGSTKPVVVEAPPAIVRIPMAQGKHELQPHVIRVASPPAVVVPSEPHIVHLGTPAHAVEEPTLVQVKSPPHQIVDPVPQVVHLKSEPNIPLGPRIIRVATAMPQPDLGPAQPQEGPQVIRVTSPRVESPPPAPQPGPQVIRVTSPRAEPVSAAPSVVPVPPAEPTIIRLGSSAPVEPQIIRVTLPKPEPAPVVMAPAPAPVTATPAAAPAPTPAPAPAPPSVAEAPQIIRLASRTEERPQIIRVGSAIPQAPQIIRLSSAAPSEAQIVHISSCPAQVIRVTSPTTASDASRIHITNPSEQPASILHPGGAPSTNGHVVFQPAPSQPVTSPTGTRISQPTAIEPPFSPQEGTVISVIQPLDSISHVGERDDNATPVGMAPTRSSYSGRSRASAVPSSGPIILSPGAPSHVSSIRSSVPSVVHSPTSVVGSRTSVIELERQAAEAERQRTFEQNEEACRQQAEAAEQAEMARQERFEESERERQRMFDELEQEQSIRREVAERGCVERSAQDEGISWEIAKAVRDAVDLTNAEREALMRTIEDERLAAEDKRARLLEMRDMDRALELEDHHARVHGLEEELAAACEMVEQEQLDHAAAEQVRFDQLRADTEEREAINCAQLADITNALEERRCRNPLRSRG